MTGPAVASPGQATSPGRAMRPDMVTSPEASAGRTPGRTAWRTLRTALIILVIVALALWLAVALRGPTDTTPFGPDNPGPGGARALAKVLEGQGVTIHQASSVAQALKWDGPDTTILVLDPINRSDTEITDLAKAKADLVVTGAMYETLGPLTYGLVDESSTDGDTGAVRAACNVPEASRAGTVSRSWTLLTPSGHTSNAAKATFCFPDELGDGGQYALVRGAHDVRVIADPTILTNGTQPSGSPRTGILADGNAALALAALGQHRTLVWLLPNDDMFGDPQGDQAGTWDLLPPWAGSAFWVLVFAGLLAAIWRGRRFGRLVREPLPVQVRAAETAYGRGRLYRSARAYGHAGAALRAGTADRIATRAGLTRAAGPTEVVAACAQATGRPGAEIHDVLYGPAPRDGAELTDLAARLDQLESEVNRS